jgi:hypothetical protein
MSDTPSDIGAILHSDETGIIGEHAQPQVRPFFASPTVSTHRNALALDLTPMACLNIGDVLFEFDSSVVREPAGALLSRLPGLRRQRANAAGDLPLVSVFGHADPAGDEEYNKTLSGRRASAVYGLLIHDPSIWNRLYANPFGGDDWSKKMDLKAISSRLGLPPNSSRTTIFAAYMQALCPEALKRTDFLGRGADPGGKADYQGCGEFNPLLILSAEDSETLPKELRDLWNLVNRRVVIFLFRPEVRVSTKEWPCPRATEATTECRKRFFRNAQERLTPGPERRYHFGSLDETFACRFYDRIAGASPCERFLRTYKIRLFDPYAVPLPHAPFTISDGKRIISDFTNDEAYATVRDLKVPAEILVSWRHPQDDSEQYRLNIHVEIDGDDDESARRRLHNLGYERWPDLEDNVRAFQQDHQERFPGMTPSGKLDDTTRAALKDVHANCNPSLRSSDSDEVNVSSSSAVEKRSDTDRSPLITKLRGTDV